MITSCAKKAILSTVNCLWREKVGVLLWLITSHNWASANSKLSEACCDGTQSAARLFMLLFSAGILRHVINTERRVFGFIK